ncbi:uncharacterized protein LOC122385782 [Amphibalanus amphitrite]|uniref:uncharacterized protein LOC122385782 n=1 Tax=Amphibalanus amphitrite TaxID=1232801 RepID=UPI001C91997C|nr:uncharacterized protein LOC122385782 [Amphibalanus amphitrite]
MRAPLVLVLVLLAVIGHHVTHAGLLYMNINRYLTQLRSVRALFEDWEYAVPVGTAFFLTAITAAQYGFLPVRNRHIADGVEAINRHLRALSWPSKRYRQPRAALASPLPVALQVLVTAFRHLEEGLLRHDRPRAAHGVRRRL